jgi:hypothetical protein
MPIDLRDLAGSTLQGKTGATGIAGATGIQGIDGASGATGPQGASGVGATGAPGSSGVFGASGIPGSFGGEAFLYVYEKSFVDNSDPGVGKFKFNNVNLTSVNRLYIDTIDAASTDVTAFLITIDDSTSAIKGHFSVSDRINSDSVYALFAITNNITIHTGYIEVPVSYLSGDTSINDEFEVIITFARTGDRGDLGPVGATGPQGELGASGSTGLTGATGATGYQGASGATGVVGATGAQGIRGASGSTGIEGATGSTGPLGLTGATGVQGIQGPQGASGSTGLLGPRGGTGPQGVQGLQGPFGASGIGASGAPSTVAGATGASGAGGSTGPTGATGIAGASGANSTVAGATGARGASGSTGPTGATGISFVPGATGLRGASGATGISNVPGATGATGTNGSTGPAGSTGAIGQTGASGATGSLAPWIIITGSATVSNGQQIIANSVSGPFNLTLPASPTLGNTVVIQDGNNWKTNNVTVLPGVGSTIEGQSGGLVLDVTNALVYLIYDGSTWQVSSTIGAIGATGFTGATGALVPWTVVTTNTTMVSGRQYIANSTGGSFNLTLPTAVLGSTIAIQDGGNWRLNNVTVIPSGGATIEGQATDLILNAQGVLVYMIYDGSTWQVASTVGAIGASGVSNIPGATGQTGFIGSTGPTGVSNVPGATGAAGATGTGLTGATGIGGINGATGTLAFTVAGPLYVGSASGAPATPGATGSIRASNEITAYFASDERLKENIQPIEDALTKLRKLKGVMFDWKDEVIKERGGEDGYFVRKHDTGIIAQEVEKVLPEVVADRQDGYKAVRYEKLAGLIIQAINELADQVDILKNKVE